jgi:hypothetical protein
MATRTDQLGWSSYVSVAITATQGKEDGEGRRRGYRDSDPNHSMRTYQRISNRPEHFSRSRLPRVSLNTLMRLLVNGTERTFNPLHFVLVPEGLRAIERRDPWLRAPFPFVRERAVPLTQTSRLDLERCEYQQVFMDSYNRILGSLDGIWQGDLDAAVQNLLDGLFVLIHYGTEVEAKRRAEERHTDILLRKRREVSRAVGTSSIEEQMIALAKKERSRNEFFQKGGSGGSQLPGPQFTAPQVLVATTASPWLTQIPSVYPTTFPPIPSPATAQPPLLPQPQQQQSQFFLDPNTSTYSPLPVLSTAGVLPQSLWHPSNR